MKVSHLKNGIAFFSSYKPSTRCAPREGWRGRRVTKVVQKKGNEWGEDVREPRAGWEKGLENEDWGYKKR